MVGYCHPYFSSSIQLCVHADLISYHSNIVYLFSLCSALIYWVLDSVFLMKNRS
ncbi:UPF0715 family protein [Bacillus pumilus]|nr:MULTISPECIES: UPF0715 family protein [Bacillus]MDF2002892.1 UPF0715 family protein [Bacillus pumilus]MDF2023817.1 UPF0715 family protein [Bacillus pumilus]MDF2027774.1 UPF0715 family protein [Bacillus pumilus]MDF2088703.1 UPF0715 family protein [Bacillus pumilus]